MINERNSDFYQFTENDDTFEENKKNDDFSFDSVPMGIDEHGNEIPDEIIIDSFGGDPSKRKGKFIKRIVPTGYYVCEIKKSRFVRKEKGHYAGHIGIEFGMKILRGEYKGQFLWVDYMVEAPKTPHQKDYRWAFEYFLKAARPDFKVGDAVRPHEFIGCKLEVQYDNPNNKKYGYVRACFPHVEIGGVPVDPLNEEF
jgi:hypothetical protein